MWHTVLFLCMVLMLGLHSALAASWEDCDQGEDVDRAIQACTETQRPWGLTQKQPRLVRKAGVVRITLESSATV